MQNYSNTDLISAYLRSWTEGGAENSWANDALDGLVWHDPERAWSILLALISKAPSDEILSIIAAGPLENLLCEHGPQFIDRFIAEAQTNKRLKEAAHLIWGETQMATEVYARLQQFRKNSPPERIN
jgi:hypothetical protein